VWHAHYDSIRQAYEFEKRVQGWSRAKRIALIEERWDDLPELSRRSGAREQPPPAK
jgi:putative endonuclease